MSAEWRWLSQTDDIPGYWATSWRTYVRDKFCIGIISVVLEKLGHLHEQRCIHYYTRQQDWSSALNWARKGFSTWPSYARNARGGVVVEGSYVGVTFPGFATLLPRVVLCEEPCFPNAVPAAPWTALGRAALGRNHVAGLVAVDGGSDD